MDILGNCLLHEACLIRSRERREQSASRVSFCQFWSSFFYSSDDLQFLPCMQYVSTLEWMSILSVQSPVLNSTWNHLRNIELEAGICNKSILLHFFFHFSIDSLELLIALQFFKGDKCFAATLIQLGVLNPNTTTHYNFLTDTINTTKHKSSSKLLSSITQYNVVRFMVHANLTKWVHHAYEVNTIHIVPHINTD